MRQAVLRERAGWAGLPHDLVHAAQIRIVGFRIDVAPGFEPAHLRRRQVDLYGAGNRGGHFVLQRQQAVEFSHVVLSPDMLVGFRVDMLLRPIWKTDP
jgi:hypothetical protein